MKTQTVWVVRTAKETHMFTEFRHVLASMELTYSGKGQKHPDIIHNTTARIEWSDGTVAQVGVIKDAPDHL